MLSLLKIEWLKIKKYPAFWWMLGIVALSYPGVNSMFLGIYRSIANSKEMAAQVVKALIGNPFAFPDAWQSVAYFSSVFVVIPAVLVIMLINNEYSFKTNRQNIIDGWSRNQFIASKLIDVAIISVIVTLVYVAVTLCFAVIADNTTFYRWIEHIYYIPLFLLQTFAQLSLAFLAGYFIKKSFLALGIFLIYSLVIENIITNNLQYKKIAICKYFPFEISDRLIPRPEFKVKLQSVVEEKANEIPIHIVLTILLTTLVWFICFKHHQKKDL
jgi:ABC-type transport system involved in multi-copper enzyme maturation permease subunit